MERALALFHSSVEPGAQDIDVAVVGHLEVVDASHDGRQELVRSVGRLCRLADDGEHGRESLEACGKMLVDVIFQRNLNYANLPPMGNLGLPVMNCKKPLRPSSESSLITCSKLRTLLLSRL